MTTVDKFSKALARRDLKRRREQREQREQCEKHDKHDKDDKQDQHDRDNGQQSESLLPSLSATPESDTGFTAEPETFELFLTDVLVRERLLEAPRRFCNWNDHEKRGATFMLRTTMAAFLSAQAVQAIPFGIEWPALLHVCFYLVKGAFNGYDHHVLGHHKFLEGTCQLSGIINAIGTGTPQADLEARLIKAARGWSRSDDNTVYQAQEDMWRHVHTPNVRLALEGVLWPCKRACRLF